MSSSRLRRLLPHEPADPVPHWSARASDPGRTAVMWPSEAYNGEAHRDQVRVVEDWLPQSRAAVLDLGCGTGRLAPLLAERFERYEGVDLAPMVEVARTRHRNLTFHASRVQDFPFPRESVDLVLSMACLGNACLAGELPAVADGILSALRPGGRVILVDAFHRFPALVRAARISSPQVIDLFEDRGMRLRHWSGLHFIPVRLVAARAALARWPAVVRGLYRTGEVLCRMAPRLLGDYQVIVLDRDGG